MEVKVTDLIANPYRDIKNYPPDPDKVTHLLDSISETGFWDNILARRKNGKFEIAYGHHRLIALQSYFKDEPDKVVNIPVKELDNIQMIRIMASENHENWGESPLVLTKTVKAAKEFLEDDANEEILKSLPSISKRTRSINYKVGAKIIADFLGKNYTESQVAQAQGLTKKDSETNFDLSSTGRNWSMGKSNSFANIVVKTEATPEQQKEAAKEIGDKISNLEGMKVVVEKVMEKSKPKGEEVPEKKDYISPAQKEVKLIEGYKNCTTGMKGIVLRLENLRALQKKYSKTKLGPESKALEAFNKAKKSLSEVLDKVE